MRPRGRAVGAAEIVHERLPLLLRHRRQRNLDALHAGERHDGLLHVVLDPVLERAALDRDQHRDADGSSVHLDVLEHADVLDRPVDLRVEDVPERRADLFGGGQGRAFLNDLC